MGAYEQVIRVSADTSPAERAVGKLTQGLGKVERLAKGALDGLKTGRLNFDTRGAEQQITRLQRGIKGLSQTVRLRVQETVDRQRQQGGNSTSTVVLPGSNGRSPIGNAGLAAAAGAAANALQQQSAAIGDLVRDGTRYEQLQEAQAAAADKVRQKTEELAQAQRRLTQNQRGFPDAGRSLKQSLSDNSNAVEMRIRALERYQQELADTSSALRGYIAEERRAAAQLSEAEYRRTGGLSFDERLAARRGRFSGAKARNAAAAGVGAAGLSIPGLDAVVGGAGLGFAAGGPAGAAIGAAAAGITALGAAAVRTGGKIATFYGELSKARVALAGISTSNEDYKRSIDGLAEITDRLNLPLKEATQQYTRLRAATAAVGLDANKTLGIFKSLASANAALGGDAERLNGILLATTQIFSKGKVSAEELRGQLGERLAGAFADFAKATGKSTADLDAALEKGEVSLRDFVEFSEYIGKKYGKNAELMAKSSETAGDRLEKAWEKLQLKVGPELQKLGAGFQDFATSAVTALVSVIDKLGEFGTAVENALAGDTLKNARTQFTRDAARLRELYRTPKGQRTPEQTRLIGSLETLQRGRAAVINAAKPQSTGGATKPTNPDLNLTPTGESEDDRRRRLEKERQVRSELRQLAIQQAELEGKLGQIGLDRISQLVRQKEVAKELLGLQKADITAEGGPLAEPRLVLAGKEYLLTIKQIDEELQGVADDLYDIALQGSQLRTDLLGGQLAATETPLQAAIRAVNDELAAADKQALELLKKVNALGGTSPATANARGILDNLRRDIATSSTPEGSNRIASQRLAQSDTRSLEEQVRQLQRGSAELSTLDQLMIKYGADWEKLDPTVKGHLTDLARTKDALTAMQFQQQQLNDAINGMGLQFKGLFDTLIQGTNDWQAVLTDTLRQFSSLLFNAGINMLAADDGVGRGFFSFLNGTLGKRAAGGPVTGGTPYIVGEKGPELFVPGSSGRIVPNDAMGGVNVGNIQIVNNLDGSGDVQADSKRGAELGRMMNSAVTAILLRERRPGGLLAR